MLNECRDGDSPGQATDEMNMVMPATCTYCDAANLIDVMANHSKHFLAISIMLQVRSPFFGAEYDVQTDTR